MPAVGLVTTASQTPFPSTWPCFPVLFKSPLPHATPNMDPLASNSLKLKGGLWVSEPRGLALLQLPRGSTPVRGLTHDHVVADITEGGLLKDMLLKGVDLVVAAGVQASPGGHRCRASRDGHWVGAWAGAHAGLG